jgi:glycosyltransferase involved in cell wall biosynthesis
MEKSTYVPRTALVACSRLVEFAGAEIASIEIAEALRDMGVNVELAALEIGAPVEEELRLLGLKYIDLSSTKVCDREFDLLWVSHYVVAYHLLLKEELKIKIGIYSSLSFFEPLETPPLSSLSFSRYTVNSEENLSHFINSYPALSERVSVFPNACPARFLKSYRESSDNTLKSIAVISNHPPAEITELISILRSKGVNTDLIGIDGKQIRVTSDVLANYSAVISIGKTVQYCLATGTPVYCYDRFGGPGWITLKSFNAAKIKNFSGRCTPIRRSAQEIIDHLLTNFSMAVNQREGLRALAMLHFNLIENLTDILNTVSNSEFTVGLSATDKKILSHDASLFINQRQIIFNLSHIVAEREHLLNLARREFASVIDSTSWKITSPLRDGMRSLRLVVAHTRLLITRARFVLRQEGVLTFTQKSAGYFARQWRRSAAKRQLVRYEADIRNLVQKEKAPLVTFVIPIYDRTDVLRTSVESALGQSVQVFEVILVADGSPADTLAVVEEYRADPRVRIFSYPVSSGNAVRGRNKGILEARGRYIAFLDSDDIAAPDRLEVCLPILESGKADVVYGAWRALLDGSREVGGLANGQVVYSPDCDLAMLEKICVPCQSTVMVRRDLLLRTGFLKIKMGYREDHELWVRLAYHGARFKAVPHVLTDLRLHAGNNELNFKTNDAHWEVLVNEEYRLLGPKPKKIAFLLAGVGISGGAAVVFKHVGLLMEQGHDAFVINLSDHGDIGWYGNPSIRVYGIGEKDSGGFDNIDLLFATFWTTVEWLEKIPARRKLYLVQSDERLFYDHETLKEQVADTYRLNYEYVTITQWLIDMLRNEFGQRAAYVPNGLDNELFYPDEPLQAKNPQRPRVLIEGPISVPFKGMVAAYEAVSELDCELWIVSSNGSPERHWRFDRFFEGVDQADMRRIYSSCDILLKMSRVESFAYPPLEAMACGCVVVLGDVNGGVEYAHDGQNVLKVAQGDVKAARRAVLRLLGNTELQQKLKEAGFATARLWSWEQSKKAMLDIVESST